MAACVSVGWWGDAACPVGTTCTLGICRAYTLPACLLWACYAGAHLPARLPVPSLPEQTCGSLRVLLKPHVPALTSDSPATFVSTCSSPAGSL